LKVKKHPSLINPIGFGKTLTDFGDSIEFISYAGHLNRNFNVSINLGLDVDFCVKGKRRVTAQLYYEQGLRKITTSTMINYLNDEIKINGSMSSFSRGSALNFKLAFPIEILKKFTNNSF